MSPSELQQVAPTLPMNGLIALARIRSAVDKVGGERSTDIILERTEGKVEQPVGLNETKRIVLIFPETEK